MPIQVTCSSCKSKFNAPDAAAGKKTKCPKCAGVIQIPEPAAEVEIFDAVEEPKSVFSDEDFEVDTPPLPAATNGDRKPCPKCGEMIQNVALKCRFCGEVFDPTLVAYQRSVRGQQPNGGKDSLFLHISVTRLVVLSILTLHLYEAYWVYKNWQFVKKRDGMNIWPFWRGVFGIFFCHSLLNRISTDEDARSFEKPTFSPGALATGWVVLLIIGNIASRTPGVIASLVSAFMPSFLCLIPVQKYVNSVSDRRGDPYQRWSVGHIVCIVIGLVGWFGILAELLLENV